MFQDLNLNFHCGGGFSTRLIFHIEIGTFFFICLVKWDPELGVTEHFWSGEFI